MQHSLVLVLSVSRRIPNLAQSMCRQCWTGNKRGELGFGFVCLGNWLFPRMEEEDTALATLAGDRAEKRLVALVFRLSWCCLWVTSCPCCVRLHRMPWPVPVPSVQDSAFLQYLQSLAPALGYPAALGSSCTELGSRFITDNRAWERTLLPESVLF